MRTTSQSKIVMAAPRTAPAVPEAARPKYNARQLAALKYGLPTHTPWVTIREGAARRQEAEESAKLKKIVDYWTSGPGSKLGGDSRLLTREEAQDVLLFGANTPEAKARVAATEKAYGRDLRALLRGETL